MTCKLGISDAHRLACRDSKRTLGEKHFHVHCTCTMHPNPIPYTAPSRYYQGVPMCRVWCPWPKVSFNRRTPRQKKCNPPLARAAGTPQEQYPQWILSWYSIRVTSKFGIGGAAHVTCRCVRIFLQALTRRHVSCATCRRSTQDRHHYRSGGSARRMVPRRFRSDQPFGRYSRKCLDTQTSQLKCRSLTSFSPPTTHKLQ